MRVDDLLKCIFVARDAVLDDLKKTENIRKQADEKQIFSAAEILRSFEKREFELYYQPRINLAESLISGIEAFVYWNSPHYGLINMDELVAKAESTDFLLPFRVWFFDEICRQTTFWQQHNSIFTKMSVNVFSIRPDPAKFKTALQSSLTKYALDPKYFDIEISEKAVIAENRKILAQLSEVLEISLTTSIDSNDSNYISVLKLCTAPVDTIKINDTFINGLPYNENDSIFVRVVLDVASSLKIKTLAAGLKNKYQFEFLRQQGCDMAQGDFICPPLPAHQLEKFFAVYVSECKKSDADYNLLLNDANSPDSFELIIKRLEKELTREKLINLLYEMVISAKDISLAINNSLKMLGQYLGVSQAYILEVSADGQICALTYNWIANAKEGGWERQQSFLAEGFYNYYALFHAGVLCVNDISELPEPFFSEYKKVGYTSFLQAVIILKGKIAGHIGFYNKKDLTKVWGNNEIRTLKSVAVIFSFALSRARAEEERDEYAERLKSFTNEDTEE